MSISSGAQRASGHTHPRHGGWAVLFVFFVAIATVVGSITPVSVMASTAPKVVVIVGPAGSATARYREIADQTAAEARRYTPNVVKVYSPNATWSRVKTALSGATIVVYLGRGSGFPSPRSTTLRPAVQDGFGLNPVAGANNSTTRFFGESYVRTVPLARRAVVLLSHVWYASGNSEPGWGQTTRAAARRRVDNFGAGFLAAGASAVIAEMTSSPVYYVRAIFTRTVTLDAMWRASPTSHGHATSFSSTRMAGAVGRTDPVQRTAGYNRSTVGQLATSTATVRGTGWLAPTPAGITVPASIDATCSTSVSSALNAWIASKPNGSTLVFPAGSCYRLGGDSGLNLTNRIGLTLVGTGSTLQLRTTGASNFSSAFFLQQSDHITIRGFAVDGGNTATGTTAAGSAVNEHINGAAVRAGCDFVEFDHVSWDRLRGFGVILSDKGGAGDWPEDVSIHDSTIRGGEMGVAIVAGRRVQIVHNAINDSVYIAIDLEPDQPQHGFQDLLISDNDVTRYAWGQNLTSWFVAANPADAVLNTTVMDGLTITGNRVHVGAATADNGNADGLGGLGIRADKSNLKRNVTITNNSTPDDDTRASSAAVISLANVENLIVTGNHQPIANGSAFVRDTGTTGTRAVSGNDITP